MTKEKRREKFESFKPFINFGITGLVELFTQAVCTGVMSHVSGGKIAKIGARIGAGLVGLMIGDQVSDYVCDGVMNIADNLDDVKTAIDEAKDDE